MRGGLAATCGEWVGSGRYAGWFSGHLWRMGGRGTKNPAVPKHTPVPKHQSPGTRKAAGIPPRMPAAARCED